MASKEITNQQFENLIEDAIAMEEQVAKEAGAIGYMARVLTQATMPHRQHEGNEFRRTNGNFTLTMLAPSDIGLPWGSMPRLLLAWITTEAVLTQSPHLVLGASLTGFMKELGLQSTGGRWGTNTRLRTSMRSLFSTSISCQYRGKQEVNDCDYDRLRNLQIVEAAEIWWSTKAPSQAALWCSTVDLNPTFFNEIIDRPVPIDLRAIKALKGSPMALDIYIWLTCRMSYLTKPTVIPWPLLQMQFGADYANTKEGRYGFKRYFLYHLSKVHLFYRDVNAGEHGKSNGLFLEPSTTHIPKPTSCRKICR